MSFAYRAEDTATWADRPRSSLSMRGLRRRPRDPVAVSRGGEAFHDPSDLEQPNVVRFPAFALGKLDGGHTGGMNRAPHGRR
jgi:hypothetical protein